MENYSYFYQAVTKIAEDRIKELVQLAKDAEAGGHVFPEAGSYLIPIPIHNVPNKIGGFFRLARA